MLSPSIPLLNEDRWRRPRRRNLSMFAVCIWPAIMFLEWDRWLLDDDFALRLFASLLFYFCVTFKLCCGWVPFMVIAGTILGLMSDPIVKGGSIDGQMWETVRHLAGGTAIGLLVGLVLDSIPRTRQIPQRHMK